MASKTKKFTFDTLLLERVREEKRKFKDNRGKEPTLVEISPAALGISPGGGSLSNIPARLMGMRLSVPFNVQEDVVTVGLSSAELN